MKNFNPYLITLIPLVLIGLFQQIFPDQQKLNSEGYSKEVRGGKIIYSISVGTIQDLNSNNLRLQVNQIENQQHAIDFLEQHLNSAKQNSDSSYAGFALTGYQKISQKIRSKPKVQVVLVEVLSYVHDFDGALEILSKLQHNKNYTQESIMKIMNIHMIRGDYKKVEKNCQKTKKFEDYRISIACALWLTEIQRENTGSSSALKSLVAVSTMTDTGTSVDLWLKQLVLDLQLKNNDIDGALKTTARIYQNGDTDLSILIQLVDHLILTNRHAEAKRQIDLYDHSNQMTIRRTILNAIAIGSEPVNDEKYFVAKRKIQDYVGIQDTSKYRAVALWSFLIEGNKVQALRYAEINLETYKTRNDQLLMGFIKKTNEFQLAKAL